MTVLSKLKVFQQETSLSNEEYTHTHTHTHLEQSRVSLGLGNTPILSTLGLSVQVSPSAPEIIV